MLLFEQQPFEVFCGDALETLKSLRVKVDCVVTSPPYFNQRQYGSDGKELGQEINVGEFIASLVNIFMNIPLQPWGNIWVNLGDKRGKRGELLCVPERFVLAMQAAGFLLIDKVVWAKEIIDVDGINVGGHCMIEPAPGRLNGNGYEPFYRFVWDSGTAWSDVYAVNIPRAHVEGTRYRPGHLMKCETAIEGRRLTNVWSISTSNRGKGHFAPFPAVLVERPIAMTCPEWVTANSPRERIIEMVEYDEKKPKAKRVFGQYSLSTEQSANGTMSPEELAKKAGRQDTGRDYVAKHATHKGWTNEDVPAEPGIVLDMFSGTGTTGEATIKLGRRFIGIDLYPEFAQRTRERCQAAVQTVTEAKEATGQSPTQGSSC
jgi:DNA modification methylase